MFQPALFLYADDTRGGTDSMSNYEGGVAGLARGHVLLALCTVRYLVGWWVFFHPRDARPAGLERGFGIACILGAVAFGLASVIKIETALGELPATIPGYALWGAAVLAYVALYFITVRGFDRQPTTELVLIVAWAALEASVASALAACGMGGNAMAVAALTVAGFVVSMVCYVMYYRLDGMASFLDGCAPLVVIGIESAIIAAMLR
jgi:hypothetical protein